MNILKAVNLRKIYGQGETEVRALDGINLEVEKGEFVAIVGTSGSGKSTLLHIIGVFCKYKLPKNAEALPKSCSGKFLKVA